MAILSNESLFSNEQAVTVTALSTNVIDLGERGTPVGGKTALIGDISLGNPIEILCQVNEDFATLTSLKIAIEVGATASLGTEVASITVLLASLVTGYQFPLRYLPTLGTGRYLGLRYTVAGSTATAGKVTAGVTLGNQTNRVGV